MSIKVMNRVWGDIPPKRGSYLVGGSQLLVLLAIADYASDAGVAWPSVPTLAAKARISERQVIRITRALQENYQLAIFPRWNPRHGGPTSNAYIVLTGSTRKTVRIACGEIRDLGGDPDRLSGVSDILFATPDKLSVAPRHARQGDRDNGDTTLLTGVSHDPLINHQGTTTDPNCAEAGASGDSAWLKHTRIEGESEIEGLSMGERAKIASPVAPDEAPDPGLPEWERLMRKGMRGLPLPGDFVPDDVINYCQRFYDRTSNPPPAHNAGSKNWRSGAVTTIESFLGSLRTLYETSGGRLPPVERQRRLFNLCVDIFFAHHTEYAHISAPTPRSLSNSMASLIGNAQAIFEYYALTNGAWPDDGHVTGWIQIQEDEKRAKTKTTRRRRPPAPDNGEVRDTDASLAGRLLGDTGGTGEQA